MMGRDMQHSKNEAVKKAPCINAGDLTPSELREWIIHLANNAEIAGLATEHTLLKLQSAEHSLRSVLKDLEPRISFLVSDQIIHSEDHSSAIQEELATLNKVVECHSRRSKSHSFSLFSTPTSRLSGSFAS
ncbi:hypothetical protein QT351_09075 [Escherichia coli]|nr:hypothetical protein [Escherichia coli]